MRRAGLLALMLLCAACPRKAAPPPPPAPAPDATALYTRGKKALDEGHVDDAVRLFLQARIAATDDALRANTWLGTGAALAERGDHLGASYAYRQVAALQADDPDAWRVLALELNAAGDHTGQAQALEHLLVADPDDLAVYLELAGLDTTLHKLDSAKDLYVRYEARRKDLIVRLGTDKDPAGRADAAISLGGARDTATARALVLALTDRVPAVRVACAAALGSIGLDIDPAIRPAVSAALAKETDPAAHTAIRAALDIVPPARR